LPRSAKLRNSGEFRVVYESGRRYDGLLMTAFVCSNPCREHRLGITASRKLSSRAVGRNRAKRLLRETFRSSEAALIKLQVSYDWVLNAKRPLLEVKMSDALDDFQNILRRVAEDERKAQLNDRQRDL
jgi:ribonuclease P protein component